MYALLHDFHHLYKLIPAWPGLGHRGRCAREPHFKLNHGNCMYMIRYALSGLVEMADLARRILRDRDIVLREGGHEQVAP